MKKIILLFIGSCLSVAMASAQASSNFTESNIFLETAGGQIHGTFTEPVGKNMYPAALIIAGSGPTDRDGNNSMMKNDGLKQLAHELANKGIASIRYDKRGIGASSAAAKQEKDLRFDDFIIDAEAWIERMKNNKKLTSITVIGHSEGSLIGMIAAAKADKFISLAGAGQKSSLLLKEQFAAQPKEIYEQAVVILDSLDAGLTVKKVNPLLLAVFRPGIQPYLMSWFKYDPQTEIKKLSIPVLIVQGTTDIQVSVDEAKKLSAARPDAGLVIIENMNHVLKTYSGDRYGNIKTYNDPGLMIPTALTDAVTGFILK